MFKYIFFVTIIFFSCSIFSKKTDSLKDNLLDSKTTVENPFFSMRRTACFGTCPTYEVSFYNDGKVFYEGKKFVKNEGLYNGQIDIKTIALIQTKIREIDFFNLDSVYDARISDLPSVILQVNMDGKKYKIIDRYKGPKELREFETFIDNIILKIEDSFMPND